MKQKKLVILFLTVLSVLPLLADLHEFKDTVIFGDSLSDMGSIFYRSDKGWVTSKMVAGDGSTYADFLSQVFTGHNILPARLGGTDYAYSGALVSQNKQSRLGTILPSIFQQVVDYTSSRKGKLDPHNLYVLWGGGNDIEAELKDTIAKSPLKIIERWMSTQDPIFEAQRNTEYGITPSSIIMGLAVDMLAHRGADYILVPNLPDFSLSPIVLCGLPYVLMLPAELGPPWIKSIANNIEVDLKKLIYEEVNKVEPLLPNGEGLSGEDTIIGLQKKIYSPLSFLSKLFDTGLALLIFYNREYNSSLEKIMEFFSNSNKGKVNIVFLDFFTLFHEVINNPKFYGIDDIFLPACRGAESMESACKNRIPGVYYNDKNYLWSDSIHPSAFMHHVYAQYMISVFNAPLLLSSVIRQALGEVGQEGQTIFNTLYNVSPRDLIGKIRAIASLSGSSSKIGWPYDYDNHYNNIALLQVGFFTGVNLRLITGWQLNIALGKAHPYDNYYYYYNSILLNSFTKYALNDHLWLLAELDVGRIDAGSIKRRIQLGKAIRVESGSTHGLVLGGSLSFGRDFIYPSGLMLTPHVDLSYHHYSLHPFQEKDSRSTSMRYERSHYNESQIEWALRISKKARDRQYYGEIALVEAVHNRIKLPAALKSTSITFIRKVELPHSPALRINVGFKRLVNQHLSLMGDLSVQVDKHKNQSVSYSVGMQWKF